MGLKQEYENGGGGQKCKKGIEIYQQLGGFCPSTILLGSCAQT